MDTVKKGDYLINKFSGIRVLVVEVSKETNTLSLKRVKVPNASVVDYDLNIASKLWLKIGQ